MARLLILLWEHELDLLRHAHNVGSSDEALIDQLLAYTTRTLHRFSSITDTTKRACRVPPVYCWAVASDCGMHVHSL